MIQGFRSASFGMTRAEVLGAVARDFEGVPAPQDVPSPDPSVRALQLSLLRLNPGPGPADIVYLFDAATNRLVRINVGWTSPADPLEDERLAIAQAGARLQSYFNATTPRGCNASDGGVVDPNTVLLYRAEDERQGFIELVARGIRFSSASPGQPSQPLLSRATLELSYSQGGTTSSPSR